MPNVIIEAMARGLAIIASDVGASAMLVKSDNGRLTFPGDSVSIVETMQELIEMSNSDLLVLKQTSQRRIREEFLWENIVSVLVSEITKRLRC